MTEGILNFKYNTNINNILDITLENNDELIKEIKEIISYKKGIWNDNKNKRSDILSIIINKNNYSKELLSILSLCIKDNIINTKIKIKIIEKNINQIKFKIKINLINKLANLIFNLIKLKILIFINYFPSTNISNVQVLYKINSLLSSSINSHITNIMNNNIIPNYILKIDSFLTNHFH